MTISPQIIEQIKERLSFVEVASAFVKLKRSGKNYAGCCPFHAEKTPSFFVNEEEGLFNCFGCGKKGTIFNFIMDLRGFTFPETVKYFAKQVGINIPEDRPESPAETTSRKKLPYLRTALRIVADIYSRHLQHSKVAQDYLEARGIKKETIAAFNIGFAPDGWEFIHGELLKTDFGKKLGEERVKKILIELGLLKLRQENSAEEDNTKQLSCYDAFRERIIFPITRSDGQVIAFGGRIIVKNPNLPKYLNSSESSVYHKRKSFYGLQQAVNEIRRERQVYITEGYLDVISLYQGGIKNVLATCGTAVTEQHVQVIKRLVDKVTILFDGDDAGKKAAAKSFEIFINSGLDLEVVVLPEGNDPDSLVQKVKPDNLKEYIDNKAELAPKFYLNHLIEENTEGGSLEQCSPAILGRIAQNYSSIVSRVSNAVEKEFLLKIAAEKLGVNQDSLGKLTQVENKKQQYREQTFKNQQSLTKAPMETNPIFEKERRNITEVENSNLAKQKLGKLYKQLLVAIVSEPFLAQIIIENYSVLALGEVAENLPLKINNFIQDILNMELRGVVSFVTENKNFKKSIKPEAGHFPEIQELLQKHSLNSYGILEEAIRQVQIGGANPSEVVSESLSANSRVRIMQDVEKIKDSENHVSTEAERLMLAQEKLQKKRVLEQLNRR